MLLSPEGLVQLAQADVQYSQLCTNSWGKGGQAITYTYDDNGSVETKTTVEGATVRYLGCGMRVEEEKIICKTNNKRTTPLLTCGARKRKIKDQIDKEKMDSRLRGNDRGIACGDDN